MTSAEKAKEAAKKLAEAKARASLQANLDNKMKQVGSVCNAEQDAAAELAAKQMKIDEATARAEDLMKGMDPHSKAKINIVGDEALIDIDEYQPHETLNGAVLSEEKCALARENAIAQKLKSADSCINNLQEKTLEITSALDRAKLIAAEKNKKAAEDAAKRAKEAKKEAEREKERAEAQAKAEAEAEEAAERAEKAEKEAAEVKEKAEKAAEERAAKEIKR